MYYLSVLLGGITMQMIHLAYILCEVNIRQYRESFYAPSSNLFTSLDVDRK